MLDSGGQSTVTLSAGVAAPVLADRRGRRVAFSVANTGANPAYVNLSNSEVVVAGSGIYLAPGGILTDSNGANNVCWQGAISGISTIGSSLAVWERVVL